MSTQLAWMLQALVLSACAHTAVVSQSLADMERARAAPSVKEGSLLAPQVLAHAEEERSLARAADAQGDEVSADLHADRAHVAYERAVVMARLARATEALDTAKASLGKRLDEAQRLTAARVEFEKAAEGTAAELAIARDARVPVHVGPADATREKARVLAAISLSAQGHLLCGAARLLAHDAAHDATSATRLESAAHDVDAVLESLTPARHAGTSAVVPRGVDPIDSAARARAACLDALARTRRATAGGTASDADALLSALSARGGWAPSRDERGVVVTFRGAFKGTALVPEAERDLRELGRIAGAHASYPLQIVVHDATPPTTAELSADAARAEAARAALNAGGATAGASSVETMGAALPTTDPSDIATRGRNARLEVVFVSRSD